MYNIDMREKERDWLIDYEELGHTIMEAEKSPDLLSLSWRPRKAGSGILQL